MYLFSDVLNDCATKRRSNRIFAWTCTILVINLSLLASSANAASIGESLRDLFSSSTTKPTPSALTEKHNRLQDEFKETLMNTTFLPFISECNNAFVKREKDAELNITLLCPSYFDLIEDLRENKILDYNKPDAILATLRDYDNASLVNNFCTFFGGELPTEVKRRPFVHEFLIDEENLLTKQHICRDVCFIHIESEKKTDEKIQPICKLISGGYRLLTKKTQLGEVTVSPSEILSKKDEKEKKQEPKENKSDVKQSKTIKPKANATEDKSKISTTKAEKKGEDKTTNEQPKTSEIKVADKTADVKAEAKDEETNKNDDEIKDDKNIQTDDKPGQSTIDEKAQNPPIDEQSLLDEIERQDNPDNSDEDPPKEEEMEETDFQLEQKKNDALESITHADRLHTHAEKPVDVDETQADGYVEVPVKQDDSNFFSYLMFMMFVTSLFYVVYHNKTKVLALVIEGRRGRHRGGGGGRRKSHSAEYRRLDQNLDEAINSSAHVQKTQIIY